MTPKIKDKIFLAVVIVLVAGLSFALGRLSAIYERKGEIKIEYPGAVQGESTAAYVASKTGSKYFLPWCGSVSQIKPENRVYFATKEEAEASGYTPAANCKGL